MCGGGGNPIDVITDPISEIIDTGGDILSGAGDVVGDVLDTAGDVVSSVADNLKPATIAAIIYFASTGDPSALIESEGSEIAAQQCLDTLGEQGFQDLVQNYAGDATIGSEITNSTLSDTLQNFNPDVPFDGPTNPIDNPFDGPTNPTDNPFDSPTNPTDNPFDGPTNSTGIPPNIPTDPIDFSKYYKIPLELAKTILSGGASGVKKFLSGVGSLSNIDSGDMKNFFTNLGSAAPLAGAAGLGYLTYKGRQDTNKSIMDAYNNYLGKQSGIASAYGVGAGPQTLNYNVAGIPLAQAQPRTAEQTVVMPKAARGGSINDLYSEYSQLNNRMRNYRRLAKGGLI